MSRPTALPLYLQVSEMLIREIASGRLADGARLPPERDMAGDLGVSVGTLRKALDVLSDKGLLARVQGSGNYVRYSAEASGIYAFFRLELLEGGGLPTAELISVARGAKPDALPAFGDADTAHRIRRLRRIGGRPAAIEEIWLDGARADRLDPAAMSESLYLYYRRELGLVIARAEDRVGVDAAPGWSAGATFGPGATCGHVERVARTADGSAVEVSSTWFDPGVVRYVARLH